MVAPCGTATLANLNPAVISCPLSSFPPPKTVLPVFNALLPATSYPSLVPPGTCTVTVFVPAGVGVRVV